MTIEIKEVDIHNDEHGRALLSLLCAYALDPMGGGKPLSDYVQKQLIKELQKRRDFISLIAWQDGEALALLNAFEGFSSFAARPLINVHDLYIAPEHRGTGLLEALFEQLETIAKQRQCCKLTLEVLSNNERAKTAYNKVGFNAYELADGAGQAVFWQKNL
ncbi:GNAT family N-acetyltransferase [Agaribacterium sp. ZY112]|uniref:GNAT family N-acetyltransferase n=1 Tax=Agaribacterium sp. ZY112 TaxID=3233574 RepID=UPI0035249B5F